MPVLLIGAPQPITEAPLVILIYAVLIMMLASALASVLLRNTLSAIAAFAATMVLVALLYLALAPFVLFAVQLLVFTTVSAALLVGLLRQTTGLRSAQERFSREWIIGAAAAAALLALLAVVVATTSWPVGVSRNAGPAFGTTLTEMYSVGLAVLAVVLASSALGSGLFAMVARRSVLLMLLGTQFMFMAGGIAFVAFGRFGIGASHATSGAAMAMFSGGTAVAELAVGLAVAALIYREQRNLAVDADRG